MKTRRDFLALFGAVLVAPVVMACRTVVPEPVELPASIDAKTMLASYRATFPNHAVMLERLKRDPILWMRSYGASWVDVERQTMLARHPDNFLVSFDKDGFTLNLNPPWDSSRYQKS